MVFKTLTGEDSLYVEFWVTFDPNWTTDGDGPNTNKLFRVYAFDDETPGTRVFRYFPTGDSGPIFFWNYAKSPRYGLRNPYAMRGGPYGENYYDIPRPQGWPRAVNRGSSSLNFVADTVGQGTGGSTPQIPDRVNGGVLADDTDGLVSHEQVFGPPSARRWTKMAFFVQMNSAPGVADGMIRQWIDDVQIMSNSNIGWIGPTSETRDVRWNIVGIGGNDYFAIPPDSARHEEWYAIDDLVVRRTIPPALR